MHRFTDWFLPAVPAARLAVFRVIIYAFVLIDVFLMSNDVVNHGYKPDFYQPTLLPRLLHLRRVRRWIVRSHVLAAFARKRPGQCMSIGEIVATVM